MEEIFGTINVLLDEENEMVLEWSPAHDTFFNTFMAVSPFGDWAVFLRPPVEGLRIIIEKFDTGAHLFKGEFLDGRWLFDIQGEEKAFIFRLSKHFNLSPGDKILFVK